MPIQGLTGFGGGATALQYVSTGTAEALKGSVRFDGQSGAVLTTGSSSDIKGTNARTVDFWGFIDSNFSAWQNLFAYGAGSSGAMFGLNTQDSPDDNFAFTGYSAGDWTTGVPVRPFCDDWHHYALTYDGTDVEFFIDGAYMGKSSESLNTGGSNVVIGGSEHTSNGENAKVWISNFRISTGVRFSSETHFVPSNEPLEVDGTTKLLCCQDPEDKTAAAILPSTGSSGSMSAATGTHDWTCHPYIMPDAHRYWKFRRLSAIDNHMPNNARIGLTANKSPVNATWIAEYTSPNCTDSGTWNFSEFTYDAGSAKQFRYAYFDSVYATGIRSSVYEVFYSDDNSNWTTAWKGVATNTKDWPSNGGHWDGSTTVSTVTCGTATHGNVPWPNMGAGEFFVGSTPNDNTTWSNNVTLDAGGWSVAPTAAFDGYYRQSPRAMSANNAPLMTFTPGGSGISFEKSVVIAMENDYPSTVTITVDGTTYTSSGKSVHRWDGWSGTLTKITGKNDGSGGRTYFEGCLIDGYLLRDSVTTDGWAGTPP